MALTPGTKLGPYEILGPLGAGGMGEVYRAMDTKLDREVAIKVLPDALARDPERLARFQREAKVLASLNHSNIATIYGLEESPAGRSIAMELVDGTTLKSPLPLREALGIAVQIAEALEAAHERGITHRDLKPANIMVNSAGVVKVLDFGLAAVGSAASSSGDNSPTFTMAATSAGVIMGTAAYMAPEQAAGKPVDKRADVWSFGVVLYEMLTGTRMFQGETTSHTLADVLRAPIDVSQVKPAAIRELLKRCLDRDVKTRLQVISEARIAIQKYLANPQETASVSAAARPRGLWAGWAVAALAAVAAGGLGWKLWSAGPAADRPLIRLSVDLGPEAVRMPRISVLVSPDGTRIAYAGRAPGGLVKLYTRRLDETGSGILAAPTFSIDPEPFFSPNGEWIGFWSESIFKVSAHGGSPVAMGPSPGMVIGASWGDDNNIILATVDALWRMPGAGGAAKRLTEEGGIHIFPQVLPGSKAVVFNGSGPKANSSLESLDVNVLEFATGKTKTLVHGGFSPHYIATSGETGHLVYMHSGTLFGVAFDPKRLQLLGTPSPLLDDVAASPQYNDGGGQFSSSNTGTFVYLSGHGQTPTYPLSLLEAAGKGTPDRTVSALTQPGVYGAPRFSPDGKKLAYVAQNGKGFDLWVYDMERRIPTQLTFQGSANSELAWAPDSKHLVYGEGPVMWWIRADGSGQAQMLVDKMGGLRPGSFGPAGPSSMARLAFSYAPAGLPDVWTVPIDLSDPEHPKPGKAEPFLTQPSVVEVDPAFSPDGKFLAYASNESGSAEEIFVRPFPGPGGKWRISSNGGKFPAWSAATHELFFLAIDDHIMAAGYTIQGDTFSAATARVWSPVKVRRNGVQQSFDISPDGKRAAVFPNQEAEAAGGSLHATFLLNFFDEVRRRAPVSGR